MTPKTAEIISRCAAFRDRGISRETVAATIGAQYTYQSLQQAAVTLGASPTDNPVQAVVESTFERKTRRAVCPDCKSSNADKHYDEQHNICPVYERHWSEAA